MRTFGVHLVRIAPVRLAGQNPRFSGRKVRIAPVRLAHQNLRFSGRNLVLRVER